MPRSARDAAYIWAVEEAEFIQLHDVAAIAYVPEEDPARLLFETIYPPDEHGTAENHEIAGYFGFDDYAEITRAYVSDFIEGAKAMWQPVSGDKPPPGWEC